MEYSKVVLILPISCKTLNVYGEGIYPRDQQLAFGNENSVMKICFHPLKYSTSNYNMSF